MEEKYGQHPYLVLTSLIMPSAIPQPFKQFSSSSPLSVIPPVNTTTSFTIDSPALSAQ
jgi:hypothetical protein